MESKSKNLHSFEIVKTFVTFKKIFVTFDQFTASCLKKSMKFL